MKSTQSKKIEKQLIIGSMLSLLAVAGVWQLQTTNLSAAPKEETKKVEKEQQADEKQADEKQIVQSDETQEKSAAQVIPFVSNEAGLKAEPRIFRLQQNAAFPTAGTSQTELNKLVTDLTIPNSASGINWEYVDEVGSPVVPSSATAGFQTIYVKITEQYTLTSVQVPIPVTVTNSDTTLLSSNQVAFQTNTTNGQIILYQNEIEGKSEQEIKELIKSKSEAQAWSLSNGEQLPTSVTTTTVKNTSAGAYKATFNVEFEGNSLPVEKNVTVFGANFKSPGYFTVAQGVAANMGNRATNIFSSYQTTAGVGSTGASYEWVASSEGEATNPANTYDSSQRGFHCGYIKMTDIANPQINTVIRVPMTVTTTNLVTTVDSKVGISNELTSVSASELRGKTVPQIMELISNKLKFKAWSLTTGEELATEITSTTIGQSTRGDGNVTLSIKFGEETVTRVVKILITPDEIFGSEGMNGWENLYYGSTQGRITNPVNGSYVGFNGRGVANNPNLPQSVQLGFTLYDKDGVTYSLNSGNGSTNKTSMIPGILNKPLYGLNSTNWNRIYGLGKGTFPTITTEYYLRKDNELKQVLIDSTNQVMYVYDIKLERNLTFSIYLNMYNLQTSARQFSMLESNDANLGQAVLGYAIGDNAGFYMQTDTADKRTLSFKLKDNHGNWLSDYTKYITASSLSVIDYRPGTSGTLGTEKNYFGPNFTISGYENRNFANNQMIVVQSNLAYQLGAPWKSIPFDSALKTGYQVYFGDAIDYMQLTADPEEWDIYDDSSDSSFETDYKLSKIPIIGDQGTIYVTYPNGEEVNIPFTGNDSKEANGHLSIPRTVLPDALNDKQGSVKTYITDLIAVDETGDLNGLPSQDYAVKINVYNMWATPVAQTVTKGSNWTKEAKDLVKDPIIKPNHEPKYEFVDGDPDTSEIGLQFVKVRMTDANETTQTKIIEVPVNVISGTPPTTGLTVAANDFTVKKSELAGLSTNEINALVLKESKAVGWDNATGLSAGVSLSATSNLTPDSDPSGTYSAKIEAKKDGLATVSKTITIKVNTGLDAIGILQTVSLGTASEYWTEARLKPTVKDVRVDGANLTDYSVSLVTAPVTNRITTPTVPMIVKVTDNQNTSNTVEVEVPVRVTWGNSVAFGGSNTITTAPNAQSAFALSLHEDGNGKPTLVSGYGNLPKGNEGTPLSSSTGAEAYYQVTHYDLSGQATGVANAKEVTSGPNTAGEVTFQVLGTNTPMQAMNAFGTNGQLKVNYGDVLRLYVKDGQRALYTNNAGPTQLLGGVPNDETVFVVVTKNGFEPLYFNQLDAKDISISSDLTNSQSGYDNSYTSISSYFSIPNGVLGNHYTNVVPASFKTYPKLNLAVGEEGSGSVYVAEPTSASSNQYLKYAYDVTFIGTGPELQIVGPLAPLSFGTQTIKSHTQEIKRTDSNWGFTVLDSRLVKNGWVIQAKMENPFETGSEGNFKELKGAALQLKEAGKTLSLNDDFQTIYQKDNPSANNFVSWSADEGFFLQVPSGAIDKDATYSSRVDMILTNAPTE